MNTTTSSPPASGSLTLGDPGGADAALTEYEAVALPALSRLAEIAEARRDLVRAGLRVTELPSDRDAALLARKSSELRIAIDQAERAGVYRLERWMAEREAEAAAVKAADPGDDPERRLSAMAESMSMSSRPAADLAAEARALLAQGDARGAEVRLNAAKLTGQMHPGAMRALQAEVDAALDEAVPHRRAAVQAAYEARVRRYSAQLAMIAVGKAARDLSHTDPARPEEAVAAARAMATKPSP